MDEVQALARLIARSNNAKLPGDRLRLFVENDPIGWVSQLVASSLQALGGKSRREAIIVPALHVLDDYMENKWNSSEIIKRCELFDVISERGGEVIGQIDRSAMPVFGLLSSNVHLNGLVPDGTDISVWMGLRAATKIVGPGLWDHLAAGGIPSNLSPQQALCKEAFEEAGIEPGLVEFAGLTSTIHFEMDCSEGLRRESVFCFDMLLSAEFRPQPIDGEVERFELWPISKLKERLIHEPIFLWDTNLALIDLLIRFEQFDPKGKAALANLLFRSGS